MRRPALTHTERFCPAKLNLRLAVTGRREDGYHELSSIVVPLSLGDDLAMQWHPTPGEHRLQIDGLELAGTPDNLVLRAVHLFAAAHPFPGHLEITLTKRIPIGAGLGGGSSDAAATLLCLQQLWADPLPPGQLLALAVRLGADVPFFLDPSCAIMRGIGEKIQPVPSLGEALRGRSVLVFKPWVGVNTAWAYRALATRGVYQSSEHEEALRAAWAEVGWPLEPLCFNAFRPVVDERYPSLPTLLDVLNNLPGVVAEMSGSGSASFAFAEASESFGEVEAEIRRAWGSSAFLNRAQIS